MDGCADVHTYIDSNFFVCSFVALEPPTTVEQQEPQQTALDIVTDQIFVSSLLF